MHGTHRVLVAAAVLALSSTAIADPTPVTATAAKPVAPTVATRHAQVFSVLRADLKPKIAMAARILAARLAAPVPKGGKPVDPKAAASQIVTGSHNFGLTTTAAADVEQLVVLVMMQCAKNAEEDLRTATEEVKRLKERKDALQDGEVPTGELQKAMDRRAKLEEMLSTIMKKNADADAAIVQNLK